MICYTYEDIIKAVKLMLEEITEEKRVEFISEIMKPYCKHCGTEDPNCKCWDDT